MAVGICRRYPFRLLTVFAATFPKGTASAIVGNFAATLKGVPLGELSPQATEGVFAKQIRRVFFFPAITLLS